MTKVLVTLYEEPERPERPVEFIKKALGGPSQSGMVTGCTLWLSKSCSFCIDYDQLKQENEELKAKVAQLQETLKQATGAKEEEQ